MPGGPDSETDSTQPERKAPAFTEPHWTLFFDGSAREKGSGAGVVLVDPDGGQVKYMVHLEFKATNNMAEYEALIFGLKTALSLGIKQLLVKGDSQLIIKQVRGDCSCNNPQLAAYLIQVKGSRRTLRSWNYSTFHGASTQKQMTFLRGHQLRPQCRGRLRKTAAETNRPAGRTGRRG